MSKIIALEKKDWPEFLRFLENCYGFAYDYFPQAAPHLFYPSAINLEYFNIIKARGEIAAHLGLFPFKMHVANSSFMIGDIGAVATLPEHRNKGFMSDLINHAVDKMLKNKIYISCLGGYRHRHNSFGWETAGERVRLVYTKKSMEPCSENIKGFSRYLKSHAGRAFAIKHL